MNRVRIDAALNDRVSGPLDRMVGKFDTLGKNKAANAILTGTGLGVGVSAYNALAGAAGNLVDQVFQAVQAASDLNEAQSKANAVFGPGADEIDKWASTASTAFGQSKRQALEAAGTICNLFDAMGVMPDQTAKMSKGIVELASDLASFNNVPVDDALLALRSGLTGETEPMRRFGVALNAATVENKALAMGLARTKGELTEGMKVQARYALIMEQSANAQGDFARTSDGLANIQKTLNAQWEDIQAEIGQRLLPMLVELGKWIRDEGLPAFRAFMDGLEDNAEVLGLLGDAIALLASQGRSSFSAWTSDQKKAAEESIAITKRSTADIVAAVKNRGDEMGKAAAVMAEPLPDEVEKAGWVAKTSLNERIDGMVSLLRSRRDDYVKAASGVADATWDPQINRAELALVELRLKDRELLRDLDSKNAKVRAEAEIEYANLKKDQARLRATVRQDMAAGQAELDAALARRNQTFVSRNATLRSDMGATSRDAAQALAEQFERNQKRTRTAADGQREAVKARLGELRRSTHTWGYNAGANFADGIRDSRRLTAEAAKLVVQTAANYLEIRSPAKEGPFSGIGPEGFGRNLGTSFAKGLDRSAPALEAAARRAAEALALPTEGDAVGMAPFNLYGASRGLMSVPQAPGGGGGGQQVTEIHHTHIHLDGRQIADVVEERQFYRKATAPR